MNLTYRPVFVMIISVPISWNCCHNSRFCNVALTSGKPNLGGNWTWRDIANIFGYGSEDNETKHLVECAKLNAIFRTEERLIPIRLVRSKNLDWYLSKSSGYFDWKLFINWNWTFWLKLNFFVYLAYSSPELINSKKFAEQTRWSHANLWNIINQFQNYLVLTIDIKTYF